MPVDPYKSVLLSFYAVQQVMYKRFGAAYTKLAFGDRKKFVQKIKYDVDLKKGSLQ